MAIDPRMVKWDDQTEKAPKIDPRMVRWEDVPQSGSPEQGFLDTAINSAANLFGGGLRGAGSIGSTLLLPVDMVKQKLRGDDFWSMKDNLERRKAMDEGLQEFGMNPESKSYRLGKLGGEVAGTAGAGGLVANAGRAVLPAALSTKALPFLTAVESGGMSAGGAGMLTRVLGGATNGAVSSAMVNPEDTMTGAVVGGVLPPVLSNTYKLGKGLVGGLKATVQPFTEKGQLAIRDKILREAIGADPVLLNSRELVEGSIPTLAEATGNANIARLQSVARDMRPNAFVQREQANAAARNALFDNVAGDTAKLEMFKQARDTTARDLYSDAMRSGIDQAAIARPEVQGAIADLMKRPAMVSAAAEAQRLAKNEGIEITSAGSLEGMHYMKMALDNQIGQAIRSGSNTDARILLGVKDKLGDLLNTISPKYAEASAKFAEMSKPVNQMEFLQGLRLTDAQGNMTLAKVQNAIKSIEQKASESGVNGAKTLSNEQLAALRNIRDDLLRQSNLNLGRSAGSNTFQNIATNNILSSLLPNKAGTILTNRIGTPLAQIGQLMYNKPNQAIQEKLVEAMLNPQTAASAFAPLPQRLPNQQSLDLLSNLYRSSPVMTNGLLGQSQ